MRIGPKGTVLKPIYIELTADEHRRLDKEKTRRGSSFNAIIREWIRPQLEQLPAEPPSLRIET